VKEDAREEERDNGEREDKRMRWYERKIRESGRQSHNRNTDKEITKANGRERSWRWQHRKLLPPTISRVSLPLCL